MTADYWLWCHCSKPDNEGSPFGMCRRCFRKPHTECRICDAESIARIEADRQRYAKAPA